MLFTVPSLVQTLGFLSVKQKGWIKAVLLQLCCLQGQQRKKHVFWEWGLGCSPKQLAEKAFLYSLTFIHKFDFQLAFFTIM